MPIIIQEIVDDLQPLLTPYEAAFYWYFFRHSMAKDGNPRLRLSTRALQRGLVRSSQSNAIENQVSQGKVREVFSALKPLVRSARRANRTATEHFYRVLIPDEIEACRKFRTERITTEPKFEVAESEIDYYNVRENRVKLFERDGYKCRYCEKQLTRFSATLDHVRAVAEGGDNSFDNLMTACLGCNSRKHHRLVGDFLAEG